MSALEIQHKNKNKSLNTLIRQKIISDFNLNRRDSSVFFRLLGFLLRGDKPFPYSANSLSKNSMYQRRSVFEALKSLEEKKIIQRIGFGYRRRFSKGEALYEILSTVQKESVLELYNSAENAELKLYNSAETAYSKNLGSTNKELKTIKEKDKKNKQKKEKEKNDQVLELQFTEKQKGNSVADYPETYYGHIQKVREELGQSKQETIQETLSISHSMLTPEEKELSDKTFELFWQAYPKKVGRRRAIAVWETQRLFESATEIVDKVKEQAKHCHMYKDKGFVPNPENYLLNFKWEDEVIISTPAGSFNHHSGDFMDLLFDDPFSPLYGKRAEYEKEPRIFSDNSPPLRFTQEDVDKYDKKVPALPAPESLVFTEVPREEPMQLLDECPAEDMGLLTVLREALGKTSLF